MSPAALWPVVCALYMRVSRLGISFQYTVSVGTFGNAVLQYALAYCGVSQPPTLQGGLITRLEVKRKRKGWSK